MIKAILLLTTYLTSVLSFGVDVTFPIHWGIDHSTPAGKRYDELIRGCIEAYTEKECMDTEVARLKMSREQPASQHNYTTLGFKKLKLPPAVFELLKDFYDRNVGNKKLEKWGRGYTYTNHWIAPTYMISVEDSGLRGAGQQLKEAVWEGVKPIIQDWIGGYEIKPTSMYGIRMYTEGAILATHVDRLPLVSSCIVNVAQDVREPWPIEVYDHDGNAHNVTMEPGDMVLYESSTVLHGRPAPLQGKYFSNIFIHFEPLVHKQMNKMDAENRNKKYVKTIYEADSEDEDELAESIRDYHVSEEEKFRELHNAAANGNLRQVRQLVEKDANSIYREDSNGWQPLHEAVRAGHTHVVKYLIENGADIGALTSNGGSPLWWAKRTLPRDHSLIRYLEEIGAPEQGEL